MPLVQTNTTLRKQGLRILARMIAQRIAQGARCVRQEPNGPKVAAEPSELELNNKKHKEKK